MGLCIIGAKDIRRIASEQDAILVDLRDPSDYRRDHIMGAINIPVDRLQEFMRRTDKSRMHIFYCQYGSQSFREGKRYVREGYRICSLAGGMEGYSRLTL